MHKIIIINFMLIFIFLVSVVPVQSQGVVNPQPHPDPHSGNIADYAGEWVINGMTSSDTTWKLEITLDGKYVLHNDYQVFDGEVKFTPGKGNVGDTLELSFDPGLGIAVILENMANGLFDVSGQGLIFVRPGNKAEVGDGNDYEYYPAENAVGDWKLTKILGFHYDNLIYVWTPEEFDIPTADPLILNFEHGVVSQIHWSARARIPFAKYRMVGRRSFFINATEVHSEYCQGLQGDIGMAEGVETLTLECKPGVPYGGGTALLVFERIVSVDDGEEGGD